MIITVASGKGGTGKTTIATHLAVVLAQNGHAVQLLDADVEAPNAFLFLKPENMSTRAVELAVPQIDQKRCTLCHRCNEVCEFNAIAVFGTSVLVFPELCHACGGCTLACPENAIKEIPHQTGVIHSGQAGTLRCLSGELTIGEAKAPPVIAELKKNIDQGINIIDAPPGTSCPVVESCKDADAILLVTEPTPFGLNDLELAVDMAKKLERPFGVVINRSDMGDDRVHRYCAAQKIPVLLEIPENRDLALAYSRGDLITEKNLTRSLLKLYEKLRGLAEGKDWDNGKTIRGLKRNQNQDTE